MKKFTKLFPKSEKIFEVKRLVFAETSVGNPADEVVNSDVITPESVDAASVVNTVDTGLQNIVENNAQSHSSTDLDPRVKIQIENSLGRVNRARDHMLATKTENPDDRFYNKNLFGLKMRDAVGKMSGGIYNTANIAGLYLMPLPTLALRLGINSIKNASAKTTLESEIKKIGKMTESTDKKQKQIESNNLKKQAIKEMLKNIQSQKEALKPYIPPEVELGGETSFQQIANIFKFAGQTASKFGSFAFDSGVRAQMRKMEDVEKNIIIVASEMGIAIPVELLSTGGGDNPEPNPNPEPEPNPNPEPEPGPENEPDLYEGKENIGKMSAFLDYLPDGAKVDFDLEKIKEVIGGLGPNIATTNPDDWEGFEVKKGTSGFIITKKPVNTIGRVLFRIPLNVRENDTIKVKIGKDTHEIPFSEFSKLKFEISDKKDECIQEMLDDRKKDEPMNLNHLKNDGNLASIYQPSENITKALNEKLHISDPIVALKQMEIKNTYGSLSLSKEVEGGRLTILLPNSTPVDINKDVDINFEKGVEKYSSDFKAEELIQSPIKIDQRRYEKIDAILTGLAAKNGEEVYLDNFPQDMIDKLKRDFSVDISFPLSGKIEVNIGVGGPNKITIRNDSSDILIDKTNKKIFFYKRGNTGYFHDGVTPGEYHEFPLCKINALGIKDGTPPEDEEAKAAQELIDRKHNSLKTMSGKRSLTNLKLACFPVGHFPETVDTCKITRLSNTTNIFIENIPITGNEFTIKIPDDTTKEIEVYDKTPTLIGKESWDILKDLEIGDEVISAKEQNIEDMKNRVADLERQTVDIAIVNELFTNSNGINDIDTLFTNKAGITDSGKIIKIKNLKSIFDTKKAEATTCRNKVNGLGKLKTDIYSLDRSSNDVTVAHLKSKLEVSSPVLVDDVNVLKAAIEKIYNDLGAI